MNFIVDYIIRPIFNKTLRICGRIQNFIKRNYEYFAFIGIVTATLALFFQQECNRIELMEFYYGIDKMITKYNLWFLVKPLAFMPIVLGMFIWRVASTYHPIRQRANNNLQNDYGRYIWSNFITSMCESRERYNLDVNRDPENFIAAYREMTQNITHFRREATLLAESIAARERATRLAKEQAEEHARARAEIIGEPVAH